MLLSQLQNMPSVLVARGWQTSPAALSNAIYLVAAWRAYRRGRYTWALGLFGIGCGSFAFHCDVSSAAGQHLDNASMLYLLTLTASRFGRLPRCLTYVCFAASVLFTKTMYAHFELWVILALVVSMRSYPNNMHTVYLFALSLMPWCINLIMPVDGALGGCLHGMWHVGTAYMFDHVASI